MPGHLDPFVEGLKKAGEKRHADLAGKPVVPVEKPKGRPVIFTGEVPKVFVPDDPIRPPHQTNWEQLEPTSTWWAERLPGIAESPVGRFVARAGETLMDLPIVGNLFDWFQRLADTTEAATGYSYQAAFDESLRSSQALGFLFKHGSDPVFKDPNVVSDHLSSYSPAEQKVISAWWAGQSLYEAIKLGKAPVLESARYLLRGAAAASPLGQLGVFGEEMKALGQIVYRQLGQIQVKFEQGGLQFRPLELTPEDRQILKTFGLEWF
ncbi:MAG: hypothetical protein ACRDHG_02610, partial [Anaerolineales bacterium]